MRSCFTSFHKRVYNLVSPTTIEVESAHSVVHLLQRSTLIGVNVRKKLWKWSQRSLKEDNPVGGVLFYLPWSCRPHRYSNDITCTNSTIEYAEHEGLGANILVLRCVRWQKLELTRRTSIREKFSQVNRSASNCLTSRSSFGGSIHFNSKIVTGVRYSWKTLKTSKMNGIVWVKKDKLTTYSQQRLQRINASREDHRPSKRPFQVEEMD